MDVDSNHVSGFNTDPHESGTAYNDAPSHNVTSRVGRDSSPGTTHGNRGQSGIVCQNGVQSTPGQLRRCERVGWFRWSLRVKGRRGRPLKLI